MIEWNDPSYLESLKKLGFHSKWIMWIQHCVTTVSYLVIVNDEVLEFFTPTKGLRQGDPISLYLFLVCMEVLTQTLCVYLRRKVELVSKFHHERINCLVLCLLTIASFSIAPTLYRAQSL